MFTGLIVSLLYVLLFVGVIVVLAVAIVKVISAISDGDLDAQYPRTSNNDWRVGWTKTLYDYSYNKRIERMAIAAARKEERRHTS